MKSMPKTGDVVRYTAMTNNEFEEGESYRVYAIDNDGDAVVNDKYGSQTCITPSELPNFELVEEAFIDPGYIEVHTDFTAGDDEIQVVEVTVDKKVYDTLRKLESDHDKATAADAIKKQIAELEAELKKLR